MPFSTFFIPYAGGKRRLARRLLALIPPHRIYCEPFGGAASLLFAKPRSPVEVYNDADGELVNLFEVVRDRPEEFLERARLLIYSRRLYERWRGEFEEGRAPSDPVERALRFWYCLRGAFGADFGAGWAFSRSQSPHGAGIHRALQEIGAIHERLRGVYIDDLDFRVCIRNWDGPEAFFYCDPPYPGTTGYRIPFSERDHRDLAEVLRGVKGKWLLTIGDCPLARDLYRGFRAARARTPLTLKKASGVGSRPPLRHFVIVNYEPEGGEKEWKWQTL